MRSMMTLLFSIVSAVGIAAEDSSLEAALELPFQNEAEGDWQLIHRMDVNLPFGASYSKDVHINHENEDYSHLKVVLSPSGSRRCDATSTSIDMTPSQDVRTYSRFYPDDNGVFEIERGGLDWIKFYSQNDRWRTAFCTRSLYAKKKASSADFRYVSFISYEGGFRERLPIDVDTREFVTHIKIQVPSFCADAEVIEVGTVSEGEYDVATLVDEDEHVYAVRRGVGMRISQVLTTLNGPRDRACDIPLYIRTEAEIE